MANMINIFSRCYAVVHAGAMVALVALFLNYFTGLGLRSQNQMTGAVDYVKTHELILDKSKVDRALLELKLSYDLRGAFDWSTHVLFLYVTANYENNRHFRNEVVIYDRIIKSSEEALLKPTNLMSKYFLYDYGRSLRSRDVSLKMYYEIVPLGGFIKQYQLDTKSFQMSDSYITDDD
ncbi:signal peptidase [Theileria orientalis strain Shintoku]|uniref:Signal peptidase complex subunit 3 n=1 Tax=Theileria orientalis strain Shintoku TaxID=869250 RepID=J7MCC3_THEOR|nr:signal peptidase [Theileria orientalis strain Shintoku]BAM42422.1 signal peptidase [Theileria orientalis strain Shintoku]|eukprot:XP_009692723.1 signal peptidase [Theileria orientalis strain Shintoku]